MSLGQRNSEGQRLIEVERRSDKFRKAEFHKDTVKALIFLTGKGLYLKI